LSVVSLSWSKFALQLTGKIFARVRLQLKFAFKGLDFAVYGCAPMCHNQLNYMFDYGMLMIGVLIGQWAK